MALQGTLKDFGIGDILQLIGQQQKTGVLHLKERAQEVNVIFKDGGIVRTESSTRRKKDLIGTMLVRAELITEVQLQKALEQQRRTLQRLGDVLVGMNLISAERFRHMVQLQINETLYGLFLWKSGTYNFEQGEVEYDPDAIAPMRAESVLMEGFRRVDEWPLIRKTIHAETLTFEKKQDLPAAPAPSERDDFDDAFDAMESGERPAEEEGSEFKAVGPSERTVFARVVPGRTVRTLVDVSLLGEFETYKALYNLVTLGYLEPRAGSRRGSVAEAGVLGRVARSAARIVIASAAVLVAIVAAAVFSEALAQGRSPATFFVDTAVERHLAGAQQARIRAALDVYRLEQGELPDALERLVQVGLLSESDLRYPWTDRYHYRRESAQAYVLLPPLR